VKIRAYGKINLYLEVWDDFPNPDRRYHRLQTVYQTIGLYDEVTLSNIRGNGIEVACDNPLVAQGRKNLVYKATSLLRRYTGINKGVRIEIVKRIPAGAGLGGGSSDAVAALKGLNRLWKLRWPRKRLVHFSKQIGCDVPFFLYGHTALGEGYGEIITPLPRMERRWVLLVKPDFMLSAKWVYEQLDKIRLTEGVNIIKIKTRQPQLQIDRIRKILARDVKKIIYNRLEEPVIACYPIVAQIKKDLLEGGADCALMSGSGPTVFALLKDRRVGKNLQKKMEECKFSTWLVKTV